MKFDDLDKRMRIFETAQDYCVLPNLYMVARIDGKNFTKLTKEKHDFEAPFDERFKEMMVQTVLHLMQSDFKVIYGYTQSDEISLLFSKSERTYGRKLRKYNSILAAEASAKFTLQLGSLAAFDCRISQLPSEEDVIDYFRWRSEDALKNALSAHCYWALRKEGATRQQATNTLNGMSSAEKNELLFQRGINFNDLPAWQKRGVGFYWKNYEREGINPLTGEKNRSCRRKIFVNQVLPVRQEYSALINSVLQNQLAESAS